MEAIKILPLVNFLILTGLSVYLPLKAKRDTAILFFVLSLLSLALFELGSLLFALYPSSFQGAALTLFGLALVPLTFIPMSQTLARNPHAKLATSWRAYYALQALLLVVVAVEIFNGRMIDWVTGILDQPVFLVEKQRRFFFINTAVECMMALFCFETTLRNASHPQQERLRYIFIGYLGIVFYFFYVSVQILVSSYVSEGLLLSGSVLILAGSLLILYSLIKYPFWEIRIFVSRRVVFGCLSFSALLLYLLVSGWAMGLLSAIESREASVLLAPAVFFVVALGLYFYLSPSLRKRVEVFVNRNFFRSKHDYRHLWMQFSQKVGGSITLVDILPKISEFIADCISVQQVIIWLAPSGSTTFKIVHALDDDCLGRNANYSFSRDGNGAGSNLPEILSVPAEHSPTSTRVLPLSPEELKILRLAYMLPVQKNGEILGWLGIGNGVGGESLSLEDQQLLTSIVNQLTNLILTARLSSELAEAREWESFNRLASFVIHDLKNLATQQSMVLENAKSLGSNPEFLQDAFKTFSEATDKMISLIANLSVQKGQLVVNHQPINLLELLKETFDDLKVTRRREVQLVADFPAKTPPPIVSGDPDLLEKAFTNILLNALQSLPNGRGTVHVKVSNPNGKVLTSFTDTGSGMSPESLRNLFRPFQTTKKGGTGIGLLHTRTIIESHGGHLWIESQLDRGTKVEIELPSHTKSLGYP